MSTINTNQDIPPEMHIKICKKIAQLTKVIYTLNTKIEEHETIMDKLNEEHSKEIQNIMSHCKSKVEKFQSDCKYSSEKRNELKRVQEMLKQLKDENERLQKSLKEHLSNTELNEKQLRNGYENKYLDLQNKFLTCKTDYSELLDFCNKHPLETETQKQKEVDDLTLKHHETIESMNLAFARDIDNLKAEKLKSDSTLNNKIISFETKYEKNNSDFKVREQEYESKILKLKQFYEEELKQHEQLKKDADEKEWLEERANMISEFQLKKQDLNNRIRFLEKTAEENDLKVEELKKKLELIQVEYDESVHSLLPNLQKELLKKNTELSVLQNDLESLNKKLKLQGKKLDTARMSNDNYKQIEEAYGQVSKNLADHKKKLTAMTLDYSQLEEIHYQLKTKLQQLEEDNKRLNSLCGNVKNERTMEIDKNKSLEVQLEEKITLILLLEKRFSALEENLKSEKVKRLHLDKELDNTNDTFQKTIQRMEDEHKDELDKLNKGFSQKIKEVQNESLMSLSVQEQDFQNQLEKSNEIIMCKDEIIDNLQLDLEHSKSNLSLTKSELEKNVQKSKLLFSGLEDRDKGMEKTIDQYEEKISFMKIDFQNEKDNMKSKFEKMKGQLTEDHKMQLEKIEKKWLQRLKSATEENNELAQQHKQIADEQLDKIVTKHQSELKQLKLLKDREILELQTEISSFENQIKEIRLHSDDTSKKHDNIVSEKIIYFREEQEKLLAVYNNEMNDLKKKMGDEMNLKISELELDKEKALETLKNAHEATLFEIRNDHLQSVKALRNQLISEKEEALALVQCQLEIDKKKFKEILKVQTDEKIKSITLDFEARLEESKAALDQSYQLRQQEYLAHSRKISDLTNNLEKGKSEVFLLKDKICQSDEKEKHLMNELTNKGEEILEIRRESNYKLRFEINKVVSNHNIEKEVIVKEFTEQKIKSYELWEATKAELNDQVSSLKYLLEDVEEKFMKRPSREDDIEKLNDLTQKLFETELECRRLSEERKHYRLELVNREENFNKVFNTSPNVGYINPIEISKRKSTGKKR